MNTGSTGDRKEDFDFDFEIFYLVMNIKTMTLLQSLGC